MPHYVPFIDWGPDVAGLREFAFLNNHYDQLQNLIGSRHFNKPFLCKILDLSRGEPCFVLWEVADVNLIKHNTPIP